MPPRRDARGRFVKAGAHAAVNWRGGQVVNQISQALIAALTEIDGRIETEAKRELYPGHGKRTGTLQRGIHGAPARLDGSKVRGAVGVRGVRYALPVHRRYKYITNGLEIVRPLALSIIRKHVAKART